MKKRKGAALIWMVITFTVLMILMSSVFMLVARDLSETKRQQERVQTYYVALSGIDLTYAALLAPPTYPAREKLIKTAINRLKTTSKITDDIKIDVAGKTIGTAKVTIDRVNIDSINWIRVTSVGQLEGGTTKVTSVMRINEKNENQVVREK